MTRKYNQGVADANRKRIKHGAMVNAKHSPHNQTYAAWVGARVRCENPSAPHFHRYGGRGITFHPEWQEYAAFLRDVGNPPKKGMTLDRIDNEKGYEPGNVRWATRKEQANNRSTNVLIEHNGETRTLKQWAEHLGYKYGLVASRWKKGIRGEALLAAPTYDRGLLYGFKGEWKTLPEWARISGVSYQTINYRAKAGKPLFTNEEL